MKMTSSTPGCVFQYAGRVPDDVFQTDIFESPLEEAVYANDVPQFKKLTEEGHTVSVKLKIGQMSCIEYAAMMGYAEMLHALLARSPNADTLRKYFAHDDVVDRAYMISTHKRVFFDGGALAEANRYEAALYTAVEYNQPDCVAVILSFLGHKNPNPHVFLTGRRLSNGNVNEQAKLDKLNALELAQTRGHKECLDILSQTLR